MTFLTQVPATDLSVRDWADRTELHQVVMSLFPESLPGQKKTRREVSQILFRVEKLSGGTVVLISSALAPSRPTSGTRIRELAVRQFRQGQRVRFRVSVNAVRRKTDGKKRIATPAEDLTAWLQERLAAAFTDVQPLTHVQELGFIRQENPPKVPLQVDTVDGIAVVAHPEAVGALLAEGVGRAKAFGCGLLSIAV